eukprot:1183077-Prorocentrum_minimum.AAC.1
MRPLSEVSEENQPCRLDQGEQASAGKGHGGARAGGGSEPVPCGAVGRAVPRAACLPPAALLRHQRGA